MSAVALVDGQKYELMIYGIGAPSTTGRVIFIPSYQLSLFEDGSVLTTEEHLPSLAAQKVLDLEGNFPNKTFEEYQQGMAEADKTALMPVQISKDLVDQIKELYDRNIGANEPNRESGLLNRDIKQLIQGSGIFND